MKKKRKASIAHIKVDPPPDWKRLVLELRGAGVTTSALSLWCGLNSSSLRQFISRNGPRMSWETGNAILAAHREIVKRA